MMKGKVLLFSLVLGSFTAKAQDLHFSQTAQTPLLINPAIAGVFDGWERVIINHRNQWLGAGTQFMTTSIAADANFGKGVMNDKAHLGVGLMFFNDVGGDGKFGNQAGSLSLSGILPMDGGAHVLSAGIQGGFGQRTLDVNRLTFMSQWNGSGFDQAIPSGESNSGFSYIDASAGVYYLFDGGQNSFQRNSDMKIQVGISGFHLNAPELKYMNGVGEERLYRKYVGHIGIVYEFPSTHWAIDGSALHFMQGPHNETILGTMLRYRFQNGTKITGLTNDAFIGVGMYGRLSEGIIPSVMVDWRGFQFGVSYDITLSALRKAYSGGSLEFSLSYINRHDSLFKTRKRRI